MGSFKTIIKKVGKGDWINITHGNDYYVIKDEFIKKHYEEVE